MIRMGVHDRKNTQQLQGLALMHPFKDQASHY